jgi:hypothetical protein
MKIIEAVGRMEGFGVAHSRAQRNNNPGNINFELWMVRLYPGTILEIPANEDEKPRFAFFPSAAIGWRALGDLLVRNYAGMTVADAFNKYAPPVENQTNEYIANICKWCGLTPETILNADNIGGAPDDQAQEKES